MCPCTLHTLWKTLCKHLFHATSNLSTVKPQSICVDPALISSFLAAYRDSTSIDFFFFFWLRNSAEHALNPRVLCRTTYFLSSLIFHVLTADLCGFCRLLPFSHCSGGVWSVQRGHERFISKDHLLVCDLLRSCRSSGQYTKMCLPRLSMETLISVDRALTSTSLQPPQLSFFSCIICHYCGYCLLFCDI